MQTQREKESVSQFNLEQDLEKVTEEPPLPSLPKLLSAPKQGPASKKRTLDSPRLELALPPQSDFSDSNSQLSLTQSQQFAMLRAINSQQLVNTPSSMHSGVTANTFSTYRTGRPGIYKKQTAGLQKVKVIEWYFYPQHADKRLFKKHK